ncbi:MAG: FeoB-associated Cys-rich membrane protein [Holophaga sp.]|nr:FeoB-associated Cys-rich membrane protein [Holophaga sp.]
MTLQTWIALFAVTLAALYLAKGFLGSFRGTGSCASGCGSCGAKACPAKKLEERLRRA